MISGINQNLSPSLSLSLPLYLFEKMFLYVGAWLGREEESGADLLLLIEIPSFYLEVVRTGQLVRLRSVETDVERSSIEFLETPGEHTGVEGWGG